MSCPNVSLQTAGTPIGPRTPQLTGIYDKNDKKADFTELFKISFNKKVFEITYMTTLFPISGANEVIDMMR